MTGAEMYGTHLTGLHMTWPRKTQVQVSQDTYITLSTNGYLLGIMPNTIPWLMMNGTKAAYTHMQKHAHIYSDAPIYIAVMSTDNAS